MAEDFTTPYWKRILYLCRKCSTKGRQHITETNRVACPKCQIEFTMDTVDEHFVVPNEPGVKKVKPVKPVTPVESLPVYEWRKLRTGLKSLCCRKGLRIHPADNNIYACPKCSVQGPPDDPNWTMELPPKPPKPEVVKEPGIDQQAMNHSVAQEKEIAKQEIENDMSVAEKPVVKKKQIDAPSPAIKTMTLAERMGKQSKDVSEFKATPNIGKSPCKTFVPWVDPLVTQAEVATRALTKRQVPIEEPLQK